MAQTWSVDEFIESPREQILRAWRERAVYVALCSYQSNYDIVQSRLK